MLPSLLNKSLVIEKETTTTNRVGTPQETYEFLKECRAQKVQKSGTIQYNEYGQLPYSLDEFIVRYDDRINYKCRVIYNNNYFKIEHIEEMGRRHWLKLKCLEWDRAKTN